MDTIYALSTAPGKAGVAMVRVSGPSAFSAAVALCGKVPEPRKATLLHLAQADGTHLDDALVLAFPDGESFTGEPVVEFHLHGSVVIVDAVFKSLADLKGFRLADPGEFTRRALEHGKLDVAQVEGLADLIDAETEAQRRQALRVLSGALGQKVESWRRNLIRAAALLEATIDFADEEVPTDVSPEVEELLSSVEDDLLLEIEGVAIAERVRTGFEIAIVGPPNAGKSTLLNALAGREAAITSEYAGTTRDVIEVRMDLQGFPVTFLDTAGIRDTTDVVEAMGIQRARERAEAADIRIFLIEPDGQPELERKAEDVVLIGKIDERPGMGSGVSGKTGEGLDQLIEGLAGVISRRSVQNGVATRVRHRDSMVRGLQHLNRVRAILAETEDCAELAAEELRGAVSALDSLVGRIDIETVLDEIFASFCLGK